MLSYRLVHGSTEGWFDTVTTVDVVVMGASLGGLAACRRVLSHIKAGGNQFFALVQHRYPRGANLLVPLLQSHTRLTVLEAEDKVAPRSGCLYVAPADYHLLLGDEYLSLSVDPRVSFARPSIDVLFESAAEAFGHRVLGVILTGSNSDGAYGAQRIQQAGGRVLVQDPKTAERAECSEAVLELIRPDAVLTLEELGPALAALLEGYL